MPRCQRSALQKGSMQSQVLESDEQERASHSKSCAVEEILCSWIARVLFPFSALEAANTKAIHPVTPSLTSHVHAILFKVLSTVVAGLLLGIREDGEGFAHLLELLFFFFLDFGACTTVPICQALV